MIKMNPENNGKQNLVKIKCKTQLIRQAFWLIKCNLTIKIEYRKMKWKKTEFGNKTDFIGPYNYIYFY